MDFTLSPVIWPRCIFLHQVYDFRLVVLSRYLQYPWRVQNLDFATPCDSSPPLPPNGEQSPKKSHFIHPTNYHTVFEKWLNLPPCTTLAVLFHPDNVSLKFLPQFVEEAKLSLLNTVLHSCDQLVLDCLPALKSSSYLQDTHLDCNLVDTFHKAITQCQTTLQKKSNILSTCKKSIARKYSANWESHLQQLEVQSKLLDILPLGSEDHLWQRLLLGMPEGHLSFILRASCDCLPSPSSSAAVLSACPRVGTRIAMT